MDSNCLLSDDQLLDMLRSGKETAFTAIYERYWSVIYAQVLKMTHDEENARDLAQEVFTTLWMQSATISHNSNLAGYLYTIARNKVLNLIARNKLRRNHLGSLARFASEMNNTALEQLTEKNLASFLEKEIRSLPEKMRVVFELSRKQELSHKEIAEKLEISDKTVKKQINNALRIIRLRLHTLKESHH